MNEEKFLGCFVSGGSSYFEDDQKTKDLAKEKCKTFVDYIFRPDGISDNLKKLKSADYGIDVSFILFQFYINPISYELKTIPPIEKFRKKERSIGIPIIINDENFFSFPNDDWDFQIKSFFSQKLDLLSEEVKRNKLDTNILSLKSDLINIM